MINKRQAFIGWLVYKASKPLAKRVAKRRARSAVPGKRGGAIAAAVAGVGAALGGLVFWRRRRSQGDSPES